MAKRRRRKKSGDDVAKAAEAFSRLDSRAQVVVVALVVVIGLVALFVSRRNRPAPTVTPPPAVRSEPPTAAPPGGEAAGGVSVGPVNMLLGNPSEATADRGNRGNYLMVKPYFALAYNEPAGTPRWVSWRVTEADLEGSAPRKQLFDADEALPGGYYRVTHKDYSGSGFDRGHMCPHADRDANKEMSWATFVMTNIVPQAPHVNQGAWADLEDYCRDLVRRERARLYVVAGPMGEGGRGSTGGVKETIAGGRVRVPAACWKVVVVVPPVAGGSVDDLMNIGAGTRVIAVIMPNDNAAIGRDWAKYRTSVGEIERQTGLHFFDRLPAGVAEALRGKVDRVAIGSGR